MEKLRQTFAEQDGRTYDIIEIETNEMGKKKKTLEFHYFDIRSVEMKG